MKMFVKIPDKTAEAWKKGLLTISEAQKIAVQQYQIENQEEHERRRALQLAKQIIDIDPYEARDAEQTPQTIARQIITNPADIIAYLLEIIEEAQQ